MNLPINSNKDRYNSYDLYKQYLYYDSILSECERNIEQFKEFIEILKEETKKGDARPIYVSEFFELLDDSTDIEPFIASLLSLQRKVYVEVSPNYPIERFEKCTKVQIV